MLHTITTVIALAHVKVTCKPVDDYLSGTGNLTAQLRELVAVKDVTSLAMIAKRAHSVGGKPSLDSVGNLMRRAAAYHELVLSLTQDKTANNGYVVALSEQVASAPRVITAKAKSKADAPDGAAAVVNAGLRGEKPDAEEEPLPLNESTALKSANILVAGGIRHLPQSALDNLARAIAAEIDSRRKAAPEKLARMRASA